MWKGSESISEVRNRHAGVTQEIASARKRGRKDVLATSSLLDTILALGAIPRIRLDPLTRPRVLPRVLLPQRDPPTYQRSMVRVHPASKTKLVILATLDDGDDGEENGAFAARA